MTRRRDSSSIIASPLLVGTVTVLVTVVAVFLSYNANQGLPFVPTYDVSVVVPDAAGLVRGNEVRVGGFRVGIVKSIAPVAGRSGHPIARLHLQLDRTEEPIRSDTTIIVRPRSPLGLKYLEMTPGSRGKPVPQDGSLPASAARTPVELTDVLNGMNAPARTHLRTVLYELGTGFAGRGADFNDFLAQAPEFTGRLRSVAANLAAPQTGLGHLLDAADRALGELQPVAPALGRVLVNGARTAAAFAAARPQLGQSIAATPATEVAGTRALTAARPVLADADGLLRDLHRGAPYIVPAVSGVNGALRTGIPALRQTTGLAGRLKGTLHAVRALSVDPSTSRTLERLLEALQASTPTLDFIAPMQLRCNYISLWLRNVDSTISEGDNTGTWFRTLALDAGTEGTPASKPDGNLHANPYPHTAAPGQGGECEAGNEPYQPGQQIGNVPGNQGDRTETP